MKKYIFYNSTTGDIHFIKMLTQKQAERNCANNNNMSYVAESTVGPVLSKDKQKINISDMTLVAKAQPTVPLAVKIREKRNILLTSSDWTQASDSPLSDSEKASWTTYRQALRDVPSNNANATSMANVVWPTKP